MTLQLYTSRAPKLGLCLDFETSGSTWGGDSSIDHQALSLGMAVFNTRTLDVVDSLYLEMKFDASRYKWSAEAEAIHGLSQAYLEEHGLSNEDAVVQIVEFLLKYFGPNPEIMVMGHNVDYDLLFMRQMLVPHNMMFHVHNVKIDTAGVSFVNFVTYKSDHLFEITGVGDRDTHNALADVFMTIAAVKFMRDLVEMALTDGN
jgi:oligoribonuclease (3'-5' exoribonuclease)